LKLRTKFLFVGILLAAVPALLISAYLSYTSYSQASSAVESLSQSQLTAVRESKKSQIERYFQTISDQVITFSKDRMIVNAMREFQQGFDDYIDQTDSRDLDQMRSSLSAYYRDQYGAEYRQRNGGDTVNVERLMVGLDDESLAFQYDFIANSKEPLGAKDALVTLDNNSLYAKLHEIYHPPIRDYLQRFEYYDIFLVSPDSGDIVYSVFKELDYTTSLFDGPYANSGIARVFQQAVKASDEDFVAIDDFYPYVPSYQDPAAFIASPIYDQGQLLGVLVFQMPIDRINMIMTHDEQWAENGLGASGETYLIGSDSKMRSMSRFLIEDKEGYLSALASGGVGADVIGRISKKGTSIGLQPVQTDGARAALSGQTGFAIFDDYRGIPVLSAYAPLSIDGLDWAIMSEIDESEAFVKSEELLSSLTFAVVTSIVVVLIVAVLVSLAFSQAMAGPVVGFTERLMAIVDESDLTQRVDVRGKDEIAVGANAINSLLERFQSTVAYLSGTATQLSSSSKSLHEQTRSSLQASEAQQAQSASISSAATELTASSEEVSSNAELTAQTSVSATDLAEQGAILIEKRIESISQQAKNISNINSELADVEKAGEQISKVLQVISDIAEQTNLLALNAAIEAARAGEQGRGFAVVADEVRSLAQKTHTSTDEINTTISRLQTSIERAKSVTEEGVEESERSVEGADRMRASLRDIATQIKQIQAMNEQVAAAATEQLSVSEDITRSIYEVNGLSEQNQTGAKATAQEAESVDQLVGELQSYVGQFKA